jgi:acetylornithine/succinyldiaminopimelate/putrescine aminotransferase
MLTSRQVFFENMAQTSPEPLALDIRKAEGIYLFDAKGKSYIDLISGISVSNSGHRHPAVLKAIKKQLDNYMHLMVYGEYILTPQVKLAAMLAEILPSKLNCTYFVNSGSEATEGALKLAKRHTGRSEIIAFKNAYHGSTHGSLSVMGNEHFKQAFRPLLPDVRFIEFNNSIDLQYISEKTACVIAETIQGEAGVIIPDTAYMKKLRAACNKTGTLLILDEVQTGLGRTGKMFGFEHFGIIPDIITLAKGFGGGMPLGAFISSKKIMQSLMSNPVLGHITTFGGHPVSCAASIANIEVIKKDKLSVKAGELGELFKKYLKHPSIKSIRGKGLLLAAEFSDEKILQSVIKKCIAKGLITDWFLFAPNFMRIAPPLIIKKTEIKQACEIILSCL